MTIYEYIQTLIERITLENATEHTFRGDLQNLIESLLPEISPYISAEIFPSSTHVEISPSPSHVEISPSPSHAEKFPSPSHAEQFPSSGGVVEDRGGPIRHTKNYMSLPYNPALKQRARALRKARNLSEVLFWKRVNRKQFKGLDFDRQKIIGNYIVDFYCASHNVVIEIDGSSHVGKEEYDAKRDKYLESLGLTVIHIPVKAVFNHLDAVMRELEEHEAFRPPRPAGTPPGEGNRTRAKEGGDGEGDKERDGTRAKEDGDGEGDKERDGTREKEGGEFTPLDLLNYIYAVLHSPSYREKYKEFLKIDFPGVPYPKDKEVFWKLVKLGGEIRQIHLLESPKVEEYITQYPIAGSNEITRKLTKNSPGFVPTENGLGQVWINDEQYFDNVPETAWEFYIGGYQPAQKWLKDRKGRTLDFEDILHYQKIIVALTETDRLMKEVDGVMGV